MVKFEGSGIKEYLETFAKTTECKIDVPDYELGELVRNTTREIRISNLLATKTHIDLSDIPFPEWRGPLESFHLEFFMCNLEGCSITLPVGFQQIEFNDCVIKSSKLLIDESNPLEVRLPPQWNRDQALRRVQKVSAKLSTKSSLPPIPQTVTIYMRRSALDSLSFFDDITCFFSLRCYNNKLQQIHISDSFPENITSLYLENSNIKKLGTIRTNSNLYYLSLSIQNTTDTEFRMEVHSSNLRSLSIIGNCQKPEEYNNLVGTIAFYKEPQELRILILLKYKLLLNYNLAESFAKLIDQLVKLQLPKYGVEIDNRLMGMLRLLDVSTNFEFYKGWK